MPLPQNPKPCHCFIRHPRTEEERTQVLEALSYSRRVGDSLGAMLALAQLGPCPADRQETSQNPQEAT